MIDLQKLGRPRIDVMVTLSGIFRDLLPLQIKTIAEAAFLAASADEPLEKNFIRAHALEDCKKYNCDLQTAALRVFGNSEGTYGAMLITSLKIVVGKMRRKLPMFIRKEKDLHMALTANQSEMS